METTLNYFKTIKGKWFLWMMLATHALYAQTWTQKADMPFKRTMAVAFTVNNKSYIAGGAGPSADYTDLWEYDKATDVWTQKASLPGSNKGCKNGIAFSCGGKGYVGLGLGMNGVYKSELWEYDPANDAWAQKAGLPATGREGSACFVINNKAYIVGGAAVSRFAEVWEYDVAGDGWTLKGNYPVGPIISATGFSINNKGYVTCGYPANTVTTLTYEYDPANDQWTLKTPFTGAARQELIAFVLDNKAYCGLGRGYTLSNFYNDMYSYDPLEDSWTQEADFPGPARPSAVAVSDGMQAYVGSGFSGGALFGDFYEYAPPVTTSVKAGTQAQTFRCYPVPSSGYLYLAHADFAGRACYEIYNAAGGLVAEGGIPENNIIDTGLLANGRYILFITAGDKIMRQNMIIEK